VWTVLLLVAANVVLDRLNVARIAPPSQSVAWVYRNALVALGVLWVSLRLLEGKRLRDAGLAARPAPVGLGVGFLLGAVLVSAIVGVLAIAGSYRIQGLWPLPAHISRAGLFGLAIVGLLCVSVGEEVKNRGILFRLLEQSLGTWVAIGLSALLFGFAHWRNPGATVWSSLAIAFEGGVLLAALYAATRSLWVPIGVHWGWNLFEGPVWGAAVSGNSIGVWLRGLLSGPGWLTGGVFGPEAGLPALLVGGATGLLALVWMVRRGQVRPGPWVRVPERSGGLQMGPGSATGAPLPAPRGNSPPGL
jgi:membrane protease YdiL (CAAX protease family)